jgi:hypothetical protein
MKLPDKYIAARRAVAEAKSLKEVKALRDKAVAVEVYAKLAKDKRLIADAIDLRKRAERQGGLLMEGRTSAVIVAMTGLC